MYNFTMQVPEWDKGVPLQIEHSLRLDARDCHRLAFCSCASASVFGLSLARAWSRTAEAAEEGW